MDETSKFGRVATRGKPDNYLGAIDDDKSNPGFNIYWNGKIIEKHLVEYKKLRGFYNTLRLRQNCD